MSRRGTVGAFLSVVAMTAGSVVLGQAHHKDAHATTRPASAWTRPVQISGRGAIGSPGGTHPLAIDGKAVVAAWVEAGKVHLCRSSDGGSPTRQSRFGDVALTWGEPMHATGGTTAIYPCSLEAAGGVLHLIWPDARHGGRWEPHHKRSTDGGKTWGKVTRLSHGTDLFRIGTAVSGASVHVVWSTKRVLEKIPAGDQTWTWTWGEIYYQHSTDGGATWAKAVRLTKPDATACRPAIAAAGKNVHVTWLDRRDAKRKPGWDWKIYYKRSADGGATWGPDVRMSRLPFHARHPQIVVTGRSRVCCIWENGQTWDGRTSIGWSGDGGMYAAVSNDAGKTWGKPRRITFVNSPNGRATHAKSYASGGRVYLVWTDAAAGSAAKPIRALAAYYATSADGGLAWSAAERLAEGLHGPWAPNAVAGTGSAAAVVLLSRGETKHASVRRATTAAPAGARH